jgi:hypothetical protein
MPSRPATRAALLLAVLTLLSVAFAGIAQAAPRRLGVLGPAGTIYPGSTQDLRVAGNRTFLNDTRTRWVRLWADWPTLQPSRGTWDAVKLAALDAQVAQAQRDGLKVILTLYRFPTWANGTAAMTSDQLAATMPDRRTAAQDDSKAKSVLFRVPDDLSASSDFAAFVGGLVNRYSRNSTQRAGASTIVDVLELANEPNLQWWPQMSPSTSGDPYASSGASGITAPGAVAQMFATGQQITNNYGGEPILAGPGNADQTDTNRLKTGYASFANRLLDALAASGFTAGPRFVFTHHNYTDVTYDQGAGSTSPDAASQPTRQTNRAADMRKRLVGRWAGWPVGDANNPQIFLTEGGVTLNNIASKWGLTTSSAQRAKQADLLQRNWNRMTTGPDSPGMAMVSQYLFYTDPNYDSGLNDTYETGGAKRPAYFTWRALPSVQ